MSCVVAKGSRPNRRRVSAVWAAVVLMCGSFCLSAFARNLQVARQPADAQERVTPEIVQARRKQVEAAVELDAATKTKILEWYHQAERSLAAAAEAQRRAAALTRDAQSVDDELRRVNFELQMLPDEADVGPPDSAPLSQWEVRLKQRRQDLDEAQTLLAELEAEPRRRQARMVAIPGELTKARSDLANLERQLSAPPDPAEAPELALAKRTFHLAQRAELREKNTELEQERKAYEATVELLPLERALAANRAAVLEREVARLSENVNAARRVEVAEQVRQAQQAVADAPRPLRPYAEANLELALERQELRSKIEAVARDVEVVQSQTLADFRDRRDRVRGQVEQVGLTNAVGLLLRNQRAALPDVASYRRSSRERQTEMRRVQTTLFELEERRSALDKLDVQVEALSRRQTPPAEAFADDWETSIRTILEDEREHLDLLITDYNSYFYRLSELDAAERTLIAETEAFALYINERILWIRSTEWLKPADVGRSGEALGWLADGDLWLSAGQALVLDALNNAELTLAATFVFGLLLLYRSRMHRRVALIGELASSPSMDRFLPTLQALVLTALTAIALPGLLWYVGWRLTVSLSDSALAKPLGEGLTDASRVMLLLVLLRQTFRARGLSGAHFSWTVTDLTPLRKAFRWLMLLVPALVLLSSTYNTQANPLWRESLGRLAFVASMLVIAAVLHPVLRTGSGVLYQVTSARPLGWLVRLRYVWYAAGVVFPLALALLAASGYYYTTLRLTEKFDTSLLLIFGLVVLGSLCLRWILVNRRRLAMEEYWQRRAAAEQQAAESPPAETPAPAIEEPVLDLSTIDEQTRRLLLSGVLVMGLTGLWTIWGDVSPALGFFRNVELWYTTVTASETVTTPEGIVTARAVESVQPVTLVDLGIALLIVVMTFVGARNIPGLLELAVLRHLPLQPAVRFTIATVGRYLIVFVGIVLVCGTLGVVWSKIHWLIAALTVGLGFGLQEIFANFVSGLIVLVERPLRVGDLVTIGNINGTVMRIQMRATTIRDWNRRELIVPNKELVTGQLINWTLSDSDYRVDLRIGVTYGSDVAKVRELLLKISADHARVLPKPTPKAIFLGFGDSALEFELRICIPHMDYWPRVVTEINTAIDREFRAAGITIAFPQRDIHIRSVEAPFVLAGRDNAPVGVDQSGNGQDVPHAPATEAARTENAQPEQPLSTDAAGSDAKT